MKYRNTILIALQTMLRRAEAGEYNNIVTTGICNILSELLMEAMPGDNQRHDMWEADDEASEWLHNVGFPTWLYYSGNPAYPVRDSNELGGDVVQYDAHWRRGTLWVDQQGYLRRHLLRHLIGELEKESVG